MRGEAFVIGGGNRIGLAIGEALAGEGYRLVVADRVPHDSLPQDRVDFVTVNPVCDDFPFRDKYNDIETPVITAGYLHQADCHRQASERAFQRSRKMGRHIGAMDRFRFQRSVSQRQQADSLPPQRHARIAEMVTAVGVGIAGRPVIKH